MKTPKTRKPRTTGATSVSNTGTRQTATQRTGATGAVTNRVNTVSAPGGAAITLPGPQTGGPVWHGDASAAIAAAQARADEIRGQAMQAQAGAVESAFTQATGALAQARQRTLAETPTQFRDQVSSHFDMADSNLAAMRKKFKGD